MKPCLLECCVDSVESAIIAHESGADRLELCANLVIGGTTPGIKLFEEVKKQVTIPIRVLIRPRFGDFLYTDYEFSLMQEEVIMFREAGAEGIVTGYLEEDGTFDLERMYRIKELCKNMSLTVHRAFDMVKNPMEALEQLIQLEVDTILTSGGQQNCMEGKELIKQLIHHSENKINILVGGGVNAWIIEQLHQTTAATQFHMSGKKFVASEMSYRNDKVSMGLPSLSEYQIIRSDRQAIIEAKEKIRQLQKLLV
jgi:copper homeostasis protein